MDSITANIAEMSERLGYAELPAAVVHDCKRRIIDTFGCAIAAFDDEPVRMARAVAARASVAAGASLVGTATRTLPELAAFANSVASRYLEGNDTYPGGGHPSDCLLPILATAEASRAPAQTAIVAIALGYEVHRFLFRAFPMRKHALDYVVYTAVASAVGSAKVLGFRQRKPPMRSRSPRCLTWRSTSAGAATSRSGRAAPQPTPPATACSPQRLRPRA
jgi:2-methylcitrate dehydratase